MENQILTKTEAKLKSPYVGLIPYSEQDAKFFFGRETETEIICANLRSARLTILYGTSGVGKSSILQAGVLHSLRQLAAEDIKTYGQAEFAVVVYRNWAVESDPLTGISEALRDAVAESLGIKNELLETVPETSDLVEILQTWSQRYGLELLIILDQFEAMFNYLTDNQNAFAKFADQFAKAVNTHELSARFLIAVRSDTLSLLDYFKDTIPGLFDNRLELAYLNAPKAYNAIKKPILAFNDLYKPEREYEIEDELIYEIIEKIDVARYKNDKERSGFVEGVAQKPQVKDLEEKYVETPLLQLVMKRIWREETEAGSYKLQLDTLKTKLGGTDKIIQTHINDVMDNFSKDEKYYASKCFKYLITPMGTKIALTAAAIAKYTEKDEEEIGKVLELLIEGKAGKAKSLDINLPVEEQELSIVSEPDQARILRNVEIPVGNKKLLGYEISHDAYIPAILAWRERYVIENSILNRLKKYAPYAITVLLVLALFVLGAGVVWYINYLDLDKIKSQANSLNTNKQLFNENQRIREEEIANKNTNIENKSDYVQIKAAESLLKEENLKQLVGVLINLYGDSAKEKEEAIKKLKKLIGEGNVPLEYEKSIIDLVAKIDKNQAVELEKIIKDTKTPKSEQQIMPRIYIHVTDEAINQTAETFKIYLNENGFRASGVETVPNVNILNTQVRYFRDPADRELAEQVAALLRQKNVKNVRVQFVGGYENSGKIQAKLLEIWFAPDAFSESFSQTAK